MGIDGEIIVADKKDAGFEQRRTAFIVWRPGFWLSLFLVFLTGAVVVYLMSFLIVTLIAMSFVSGTVYIVARFWPRSWKSPFRK